MSKYIFLFQLDSVITKQEICKLNNTELLDDIEINEKLVGFIKKNKERCYIFINNQNKWIESFIQKIGLEKNVLYLKIPVLSFVAVGNRSDDAEMMKVAEVAIGYGAVREISPEVLSCASHAIYEEEKLIEFMKRLL